MFEQFPYADMQQLNLDWIIKIAKDFLDQYTQIQQTITQGLEDLEAKKVELEALLQAWYDEHSQDIADQLAAALQDLNEWYTVHQNYLDETLASNILAFNQAADAKAAQTLESIPSDYTAVANETRANSDYAANDRSEKAGIKSEGGYTYMMNGLEFVENGYMNELGVISPGTSHKVMVIRDSTITKITFPQFSSAAGVATVIAVNDNNQVVFYSNFAGNTSPTVVNIPDLNFTKVYLNWWGGNTLSPYYTSIQVESYFNREQYKNIIKAGYTTTAMRDFLGKTVTIDFRHNPAMRPGYLTGQPNYAASGFTYQHILLPANYIKKISVASAAAPAAVLVYYYPDSVISPLTLIGTETNTDWETKAPLEGIIGINFFRDSLGQYPSGATITFFDADKADAVDPNNHMIRATYNFNGKTAIFCGDSITEGMTDSYTQSQNPYPKLFSNIVHLNHTNVALAGACITKNINQVTSISEQVEDIVTPPDYLFIAGGINDWQEGVLLDTFKQAVGDLCRYINYNMPNTTVIWILPISQAGWYQVANHPLYNPQAYRNAIYEQVMMNYTFRHNIVNGMKFGFPSKDSDPDYIAAIMPDKLHPSDLGYGAVYVTGLLTALRQG